jgi:hypothetical protein
MGMEDLSIDITYDPCYFSLYSTFKPRIGCVLVYVDVCTREPMIRPVDPPPSLLHIQMQYISRITNIIPSLKNRYTVFVRVNMNKKSYKFI